METKETDAKSVASAIPTETLAIEGSRGLTESHSRFPVPADKASLDRIRRSARAHLPRAIKVWIDGLSSPHWRIRHTAASELCNRFGFPRITREEHQVEGTQVQVMVFPFENPFPPARVPEAEVVDVVDQAADQGQQQG